MKALKPGNKESSDCDSRKRRRRRLHGKANPLSPPTEIELRGVRVHFPFRPYPCQEVYMGKVLDALLRKENALLESPTGTGKTLCLLCAALAWQRQQSRMLEDASELDRATAGGGRPASRSSSLSSGHQGDGSTVNLSDRVSDGRHHPRRVPTIIYASRTHSQLSQVVRELRNTRYRPNHAMLGSREQMCVNPKVKKAHSTASDVNHDCNKLNKDRKCRFRNNLEGFVPPANEVCGGGGGGNATQPVMDMEDLVGMGRSMNICPFYLTRSQVENADLLFVPYNYLFDRDARATTLADVPWSNAVLIFDEAHNLESFASESASFDLSSADVIGCVSEVERAIHYLNAAPDSGYGVKAENLVRLKAIFMRLEEYILNLGNRTAYSGEFMMEVFQRGACINHGNHEIFIEEVRKVNDMIMDMRGTGATRGSPRLEHFAVCLKRVFGHGMESRCVAKAAFYRVHVSPKQPGGGGGGNNKRRPDSSAGSNAGVRTISYWCFAPALAMEELSHLKVHSIIVTSGTLSPLPSYCMELGLDFPHTLEGPHIVSRSQIHVRVIGRGATGKLLTSSYERRKDAEYHIELGNTLVSLAKVTPAGMLVFFPSYGAMETSLERWGGPSSSAWSSSSRARRPGASGGRSDFFAARRRRAAASNQYSFPFDAGVAGGGGVATPWRRLLATKAVVIEPRSSADLPDAISEFQRFLNMSGSPGCILMGVCRGKISEGIDFAHDMSRAVVITGLPFPPYQDPKVQLKREYLDQARRESGLRASSDGGFDGAKSSAASTAAAATKLSGQEWYTQQAHRAVNQAIGRVIRNRSDYGAVLLLDSRFDQGRNQAGLSKWLRPHIRKDEGFGQAIRSLARFYREAGSEAKAREEESAKAAVASGVVLEYENEDEPPGSEEFTKVAFVKLDPSNTKVGAEGDDRPSSSQNAFVPPDLIIARTDVKTMRQTASGGDATISVVRGKRDMSPPPERSKFDAVFRGAAAQATSALDTKTTALQLMQKMQVRLSPAEQSTIRKNIVSMKREGDAMAKKNGLSKEDKKPYVRLARDIVKLILKRERFEAFVADGNERMLLLFFRLMPSLLRPEVETMALKLVFEGSTLGELCKENLTPDDYGCVRRSVASLMQSLWCHSGDGRGFISSAADYLPRAGQVLKILVRSHRTVFTEMSKAYEKLIPARFYVPTKTLCDELSASENAARTKELEESQMGERSVDPARFRWASRSATAQAPLERCGAEHLKRSAVVAAASTESSSVKRQRALAERGPPDQQLNPYAKKPPASAHSSSRARAKSPHHQSGRLVASDAEQKEEAPCPEPGHQRDVLSLSSFVESVESSDPFVKRTPAELAGEINANVPENVSCPICQTSPCRRPLVARCGHVACMACWLGWFRRSDTCPTCRLAGVKDTMARVVYERQPGAGVPESLTQLCQPAGSCAKERSDKEESDEEELEIVASTRSKENTVI